MDASNPQSFQPQKLSYFNDALLVHSLNFPIYHVEFISERHFIVTGGGGSSKTGVINQFNVLELVPKGSSCRVNVDVKYTVPDDVPNEAIMNGALMRDLPIFNTQFIAVGSQATVYHIKFDSQTRAFDISDHEQLPSTELKCVAYSPSRIYLGALDGTVNIWDTNNPRRKVIKRLKAHNKEVDEIDVDVINQQILTLSRGEAKLMIWDANDFEPVKEFKKDFINDASNKPPTNYFFRSCKFVYNRMSNVNQEKGYVLMMATISPKGPSMLYRVSNLESGTTNKISSRVSNDSIMAMAVSLDGKSVAIGTRSGSVHVLDARNLKQIYKINHAHQNSVTDLEFLPPKSESLELTNSQTLPLISVSLDRRIVLHRPRKPSFKLYIQMIIILVLICLFAFSDISFLRSPAAS